MNMSERDMDLIENMANECQNRLDSIKEEVKNGLFGTARTSLKTVEILLETMQTIKKGSKWADD